MISLVAVALADVTVGSYGRATVDADLDGGAGDPARVVAFGPRLEGDPYAELDLAWDAAAKDGTAVRAMFTPALAGRLFHYDGSFDATLAVRNLYATVRPVGGPVTAWAGSRMLRGDDVYLLDFWPLDNLNTVGGGVGLELADTRVSVHGGLNRLSAGDWQIQDVERAIPGAVGSETVRVLDRQRLVASIKADHAFHLGTLTLRPKLYGEVHTLPAGERLVEDGSVSQELPEESAWLGGAQLTLYGWADESYVHVFFRHATGVAAYGELTVPTDGLAPDRTVGAAREDRLALAANHEGGVWGVAAGGYARWFADADGQATDFDDGHELAVVLRPAVYPTGWASVALELGHEAAWRDGPNARDGLQGTAEITRLSLIPAVQLRPGTFGRPQVRLQYTAAFFNPTARSWYPDGDERADTAVRHVIGVGAEWWINSQSYR